MALAPIPLSNYGLTGWIDPTKIRTGDLSYAVNVDLSYGHLLQKEGGTLKVNAVAISGSPRIEAGFDYWPTASIQRRIIATHTGDLYKDDMTGAFGTLLKTGLTANQHYHIVEAGAESQGRDKKLFFANRANSVQVLSGDGITTSAIGANAPSDWASSNQPSFFFKFRTALAGGGNLNDPHRIYISSSTDHEDFRSISGGLSLSVFPGEGQRLVAGLSALGKGYLWKYPTGIYYIVDDDTSSGNWFVRRITTEYGAPDTPHAVVQIDESNIVFLSSAGDIIMMTETPGQLTGVSFTNLTKALNLRTLVKNTFDLGQLSHSQLRWYPDKLQLHILLHAIGGTMHRRLILDFNDEKARVHISDKDENHSMWLELDDNKIARPVIGDEIGFVRKIDQISRTLEASTSYTMNVLTTATDFSDINPAYAVKKLFYRLHLEYEVTGSYDVSAEIFVDGVSKGTVYFNQGTGGSVLSFVLPANLSGTEIRRRSRAIVGEGYYFALRLMDTTNNNPRIARAWVEFEPLEMAR